MAQDSSSNTGSSALQVLLYWAIVAVPLGWGVYKTVQKSVPLFNTTTVNAPASPTPAPATPAPVATPAEPVVPAPDASPFSTAQPRETVAPINTPAPPAS